MKIEKLGNIVFILFFLLIFSSCKTNNSKEEENNKFKREKQFIELCNDLEINIQNSDLMFLPALFCLDCKKGGLVFLDSVTNLIVLHDNRDECPKKNDSSYKCVGYSYEEATKKGLTKSYSQFIKLRNGKVEYFEVIF